MAIKYPITCTTNTDKIEFCYIAQETLRLEHNAKGQDYKDGKLTEKEWKDYKDGDFRAKTHLISTEMLVQKEALKKSTKWAVDLKDLEKKP
jgi:hypothetical protein